MPKSSKWPLSLRFPHKNTVCTCPIHATWPTSSHSYLFTHLISAWWGVPEHDYPHNVMSSSLLLLSLSYAQISSLAPCSQTSSAYVPPTMWENKFYIHIKQAKL
jgi:hypothetical protein